MDCKEFRDLVRRMRKKQKTYFNPKTRSTLALQQSRELEHLVDLELENDTEPKLF